MRIGIVRLGSLGDIIVSAVFVPFLKRILGECEIEWIVDSNFAGILEKSKDIDSLYAITLKESLKKHNFKELQKIYKTLSSLHKFDVLIDMQGLIKSSIVGKIVPSDCFLGFDSKSAKEPLCSFAYDVKVAIPYQEHILKRNAALITQGLQILGYQKQVSLEEMLESREEVFQALCVNKQILDCFTIDSSLPKPKHILFVIESSLESKTYPPLAFIELGKYILRAMNAKIFVIAHTHFQKAQTIYEGLDKQAQILPKMTLYEVRSIMPYIDVVIGGDTGITHLAWAMQRASITLYGNTPPARFGLTTSKNVYISANNTPSYDKNDFSIQTIKPKQIYELLEKII